MGRNFAAMTKGAMGQLDPAVYKKIYDRIRRTKEGNIVEHGTGFGALTIAIAWGIQDSESRNRKVITVERYDGPSRRRFGPAPELIRKVRNTFSKYSVGNNVIQLQRRLSLPTDGPDRRIEDEDFIMGNNKGMLCAVAIDCDGHLYRDFDIYLKHMLPGGLFIIDDYAPWYKVRYENKLKNPLILQKAIFTWIQVNHMIDLGAFKVLERRRDTAFCELVPGFDINKYNADELQAKVDSLRAELKQMVKSDYLMEPKTSQIMRGKDPQGVYVHVVRHG